MTDEQIKKIKDANPNTDLRKIELDDDGVTYEFVVIAPSGASYKRWQEGSNLLKGNPAQAATILVYDCVKGPDKATLGAMFALKPGLIASVANELLGLAGVNATATVTKL